jgi:hypothetical protein
MGGIAGFLLRKSANAPAKVDVRYGNGKKTDAEKDESDVLHERHVIVPSEMAK